MSQVKNEELTLNDKIKFDNKGGAILGVLEGPVADFMNPTRNGRDYSEELWEKVWKNPLVQEQFQNGGIVGELDHPADRDEICTEKVAVIMPEPPVKKNGEYYGRFNILDTPCGRIVHTLAKAGFKLGVSSRGTGDVDEYTHSVDPDTYEFTCFDVVLLPAIKSARMNLVTESLDTNKEVNYKKLLKESLENSSEDDQKIMKETLEHLDIKLDEAVEGEKCCICGEPLNGHGNNPAPVKDEGKCCDKCNNEVVIPARLNTLKEAIDDEPTPEETLAAEEPAPVETPVEAEVPAEENNGFDETDAKLVDFLHAFLDAQNIELEEGDDKEEIEHNFVNLFHDLVCSKEECEKAECDPVEQEADIEEIPAEEAEDVGSDEIVEQLQKVLKENKDLKDELKSLQDEKAVSGAKVSKLEEDLATFKAVAANAGKRALGAKSLQAENKTLNEKVSSLEEQLKLEKENTSKLTADISKLTESKNLAEQKLSVLAEGSEEIKRLKTELEESKKRNSSSLKLVEKYKGLAHDVANRYIQSKADMLGVSTNEIKNRLNESYTLDDVDEVCEDLQEYSLNISGLPFALRESANARVQIREDRSRDPLKDMDSEYDDTVDEYLLDIAGLRK